MQIFNYQGKDDHGRTVTGKVEAATDQQAANLLKNRGLFIISIKEAKNIPYLSLLSKRSGVSGQELANFTRYLSTMLSTGLPLSDAFINLQQQSSPAFAEIIASMGRDVASGQSLSEVMKKYPKVFNNLYVSLVRAGEASGGIDKVLGRLADTLDRNEDFKGKVKGAMVYPAIVVTAMAGIGTLMITMVIPKISDVYKEFGAELPLPTKILIAISDFLTHYTILAAIVIIGIVFAVRQFKKTPAGDFFFSNLGFRLPVFGPLNQEVTFALLCRTLGAMVAAGISILEALKITADSLGNNVYRQGLLQAASEVEKGYPLSMSLKNNPIYPNIISQMVGIGEETGTIDKSLENLAVFFEGGAERKVKVLTTSMEPILILIMGAGVGGLAIAVLMPMFNLVNVIK